MGADLMESCGAVKGLSASGDTVPDRAEALTYYCIYNCCKINYDAQPSAAM
jgi:hypothetical protein